MYDVANKNNTIDVIGRTMKEKCTKQWGARLLPVTDAGALLVYEVVRRVGSDDFDVRAVDSINGFGHHNFSVLSVVQRRTAANAAIRASH